MTKWTPNRIHKLTIIQTHRGGQGTLGFQFQMYMIIWSRKGNMTDKRQKISKDHKANFQLVVQLRIGL